MELLWGRTKVKGRGDCYAELRRGTKGKRAHPIWFNRKVTTRGGLEKTIN